MSKFSLDPDMNFEVTARFIGKGAYAPVSGTAYSVRLFDNDDSFYALIKVPNRFAVLVSDTTMLIEKQLLVKTFSSLINPN